jgi:rSAM/selenodomain-associated transferase 2
MNTGARLARGKILIFLHADTELPANAFQHILQVLADSRYVAGAFKFVLDSDRWVFKLIATAASWRYRLTHLPYGDQAFFMSKDYFFRIGGFKEIPIMEDIDLMRRIKKRKEKVHVSTSAYVTTSVRRWQQEGILYAVLRGWVLASLYCLGVSPDRLVKYYRHHD